MMAIFDWLFWGMKAILSWQEHPTRAGMTKCRRDFNGLCGIPGQAAETHVSVRRIGPFDARGSGACMGGGTSQVSRSSHQCHMDIFKTRDGQLLLRCWSGSSYFQMHLSSVVRDHRTEASYAL